MADRAEQLVIAAMYLMYYKSFTFYCLILFNECLKPKLL